MGEYAEMEIFAQMRGKTTSDLSPGEVAEFYREYDRPAAAPQKRRSKRDTPCPVCYKKLRGEVGMLVHMKAMHKGWS